VQKNETIKKQKVLYIFCGIPPPNHCVIITSDLCNNCRLVLSNIQQTTQNINTEKAAYLYCNLFREQTKRFLSSCGMWSFIYSSPLLLWKQH